MVKNISRHAAGAIVGFALCFASTIASAATIPVSTPTSISPFVALSAYGTMQSRRAICGAAVGAAGVAAAAQGQIPAQGCVLPVLDPVVPVPVETPPIGAPVGFVPAASPGFGLGIGALLAGLVLVAGLAAVLLSDNNDSTLPISP